MVVVRNAEPSSGHVVVVACQGSFLLRPLQRQGEQWLLEPVRPGVPQQLRSHPSNLLRRIRQRLSIENWWHWPRDAELGEDARR